MIVDIQLQLPDQFTGPIYHIYVRSQLSCMCNEIIAILPVHLLLNEVIQIVHHLSDCFAVCSAGLNQQ